MRFLYCLLHHGYVELHHWIRCINEDRGVWLIGSSIPTAYATLWVFGCWVCWKWYICLMAAMCIEDWGKWQFTRYWYVAGNPLPQYSLLHLHFISQHVQLVTAYQEISFFHASGNGEHKIHAYWGFSVLRTVADIPQNQQECFCYKIHRQGVCVFFVINVNSMFSILPCWCYEWTHTHTVQPASSYAAVVWLCIQVHWCTFQQI